MKKIGKGIIVLSTYKRSVNAFETISKYKFKNLNTEGAIKQLTQIINKLKEGN